MFYNDNWKNAELSEAEIEKEGDGIKTAILDSSTSYQALVMLTIDLSNGNVERKSLADQNKGSKLMVYPTFYLSVSDKIMIYRSDIFTRHKDDFQFGTLTF